MVSIEEIYSRMLHICHTGYALVTALQLWTHIYDMYIRITTNDLALNNIA